MATNKIKTKKLEWIHIERPATEEITQLKKDFDFHPLDLEDCLNSVQRPQISEYSHYVFFILTFPVYNRKTREIEASEVDFFIGSQYLVTISDGGIETVKNFFNEVKNNDYAQERYMQASHPVFILYEILHRLQNYTFPMLDHVTQDITDIEKKIFQGHEKKLVGEILQIKRNIFDFRRIMQAHKNIIKKLMGTHTKFFMPDKTDIYFSNILDRTKDIWDILETQKENITAFQETNESLISYRLNETMKTLTTVYVIIAPAALVAAIFSTNARHMPIIGQGADFYLILSLILLVIIFFVFYFRRKKLL